MKTQVSVVGEPSKSNLLASVPTHRIQRKLSKKNKRMKWKKKKLIKFQDLQVIQMAKI
jgi:hypothetical protein